MILINFMVLKYQINKYKIQNLNDYFEKKYFKLF